MSDGDLAGRRLLAVTEEELRRVVLDIHDGPVQCLFAALGQLSLLEAALGGATPDVARPLAKAVGLLERALVDIRQVVGALYAPEFTGRGLAEVVEDVVVQHETLTDTPVALHVEGAMPLVPPMVAIALYRVVQEALANVRRHAGAGAGAAVRLACDGTALFADVEDHGLGFEPPPLAGPLGTERRQHVGLRGMRDRAAMVGGEVTVSSRPGAGTTVHVRIPLDAGGA